MWFDSFKIMRFYQKRFEKNRQLLAKRQCQDVLIYKENKRKNILVCLHSLDWGGAERFAYATLQFLKDHHTPYLIFVEKQTQIAEHFLDVILDKDLLIYADEYQNSAQQLLDIVANNKIDVIYIHHSYSAYKALEKLPRNVFVLDSLHIVEYQTGGYPYLSAKYSKYINIHHVVSIGLQRYLSEILGVADYKVELGYLIKEISEKNTRKIWNNKKIKIGFLGRFEKQKRPELFIELAKKMQKHHHIHFLMQGDGSLKQKVKKLAGIHRLNNITFSEANQHVQDFFHQVDILINCAENEGLTLVGIESLQYQVIFISSDVGQQNEITSKQCLISATPKYFIAQAAKLILSLINNQTLRNEILTEQANILQAIQSKQFQDIILKKYMI